MNRCAVAAHPAETDLYKQKKMHTQMQNIGLDTETHTDPYISHFTPQPA